MYLIRLAKVQSYSVLFILRICVAAGLLPASSSVLARLLQHSMLRASAFFFDNFLPEYADLCPVVISLSMMLGVTYGN